MNKKMGYQLEPAQADGRAATCSRPRTWCRCWPSAASTCPASRSSASSPAPAAAVDGHPGRTVRHPRRRRRGSHRNHRHEHPSRQDSRGGASGCTVYGSAHYSPPPQGTVTADSRPLVTEDIAAEIAEVLAPLLPGANPDRLAAQIAALRLLPAHARGLLAHLQAQPDALTSGAATGPAALRALLDVLAAEHPGVQRIRCHKCGAQGALPYRRDGGSICGPCYRRTHRKVCVRCGEEGQPAFRESGGIVCSRCSYRDPARWRACASCGTMAHVAYRVDGEPLCQTCGPRKLYTCSSCGRQNRPAHAVTSQGPLCSMCYHRSREHECMQCGRTTVEARVADRDAGTWICNRCWVPPTMTCSGCGRVRPCARGSTSGRPVCSTCRRAVSPARTCVLCERTVAIQTTLPLGPVCGPCYRHLRRNPAACASCQEIRPLVGISGTGRQVCGPCSGDDRNWVCGTCGRVDLLFAACECMACSVKRRVRELLTGPDGSLLNWTVWQRFCSQPGPLNRLITSSTAPSGYGY